MTDDPTTRDVNIAVVPQPDGTEVCLIEAFALYSKVPARVEPEHIAWCLIADWFGVDCANACRFVRTDPGPSS